MPTPTFSKLHQYAEPELVDTFKLWILRVVFDIVGFKKYYEDGSGFEESLVDIFDLRSLDSKGLDEAQCAQKVKEYLSAIKTKLESKKRFTHHKLLRKNINTIANIITLNKTEQELLEFFILLEQYDILDSVTRNMGNELNLQQMKRVLSMLLNIPLKEINTALSNDSKLIASSLISLNNTRHMLSSKVALITNDFGQNMLNHEGDIEFILKDIICKCDKSELALKDFLHLKSELDILLPHLKSSNINRQSGVNVLFHGVAGTGKTELCKVISKELGVELYEVSYLNSYAEPLDELGRKSAYKCAQSVLQSANSMLMFDEIEDIFSSSLFDRSSKSSKAWINRALESNPIITVWITNDIKSLDNALLRRFDMVVEVPIPPRSVRKNIISKYSQEYISQKSIDRLSAHQDIAPALIDRAIKVIKNIDSKDIDKDFEIILNSTLEAQGHKRVQSDINSLPSTYNPSLINTTANLNTLTEGIKQSRSARICLYGPAGTGKSAYGKYIAQELDCPLLLKKGSDLLSKWVGDTEKNIANAFREATEENAVLVFDEVDGFLSQRGLSQRSWEVTQVNEMLVQMENFDGVFIATTNLMKNLDSASLRRFDMKLEFTYLLANHAKELFISYCKELNIEFNNHSLELIGSMKLLTPGDYAAIIRQHRFNKIENGIDFARRLQSEVSLKEPNSSFKMGFV